MTMKLSQLKTHWNAGDAHMVISFLDELKDMLWASYGEEIIEMHRSETDCGELGDGDEYPADNNIEF